MKEGTEFHCKLPNGNLDSKLKKFNEQPTIRFELNLEPTKAGYAEFNYLELVAAQIKHENEKEEVINDNCVFPTSSAKCPIACDGFNYDKVIGYDTTDSFIDDSELFDEYIQPSTNGFYINCNAKKIDKYSSFKKPIVGSVLTTSKKLVKTKRKREKLSSPSPVVKVKKLRHTDDVQIIKEIIAIPNSDVKKETKASEISVTNKINDKHPLPLHLSADFKRCLNLLKTTAKKGGKVLKFNEDVKKLLISVEEHLLSYSVKVRTDVYLHLACYLSISPTTLKKKSRTFLTRKLSNNVDDMVKKLTEEVKVSIVQSQLDKSSDISSLKTDSFTTDHGHSEIFKNSLTKETIEDVKINGNKTEHTLVISEPLQPCNELDVTTKFLTFTIKDTLKTTFSLKKKLYEVKRIKTKHFLEELITFVREEVLIMWPPTQRPVNLLLDFVNEFYTMECHDMKVYKVVKNKSKENLSTPVNSLVSTDVDKKRPTIKKLKSKPKENISPPVDSSALINGKAAHTTQKSKSKPKANVSTKRDSLIPACSNKTGLVVKPTCKNISNEMSNMQTKTPTKYQKESKMVIKSNVQTKKISPPLMKRNKSDETVTSHIIKKTKPNLNLSVRKKSLNDESQKYITSKKIALAANNVSITKIIPKKLAENSISPSIVNDFKNYTVSSSKPNEIAKMKPNVLPLTNKSITSKNNGSSQKKSKSLPLLQNANESQMFKEMPNMKKDIKFIKPQNVTNAKVTCINDRPNLSPFTMSELMNKCLGSKDLILKCGELSMNVKKETVDKPAFVTDRADIYLIQPNKNSTLNEPKGSGGATESVIITISD